MFQVSLQDVQRIAEDFGVLSKVVSFSELQRHHYERSDPNTKQVRLICKAVTGDGNAYVIRFKNEDGVTQGMLQQQSAFAMELYTAGIPTPRVFRNGDSFIHPYSLNGYDVLVGLEEFVYGELRLVDEDTARDTGCLLAQMHNLAEAHSCHVACPVLFDPFSHNDLFSYSSFCEVGERIWAEERDLYQDIRVLYERYMDILAPLRNRPRFAVQGDISDCNLYRGDDGLIGVFDFNWCGDSVLFCDAVMQGMFEARNMDYPDDLGEDRMEKILGAFWLGYKTFRSVTEEDKKLYPYLMAVIDAFWSADVKWDEDSLLNLVKGNDRDGVHRRLIEIREKLLQLDRWNL